MAAGGITAVVGEKKVRPQTTKPTNNPEEAKKTNNVKPVAKPEEKKVEEKKVLPPKTPVAGKKPTLPGAGNEDISDDPIA